MRTLNDITNKAITALHEKHGAFYAFSNKQFDESKKEGVTYASLGMGLICPKENCKTFIEELNAIYENGMKQDIEENGKESIILRELYNHEAFYTWEIEDTVESLKGYGFTIEDVQEVFNKHS